MRTAFLTVVTLLLLFVAAPWRGLIRDADHEAGVPAVEMAVFEAGFGVDWHKEVADAYEQVRRQEGKPIEIDLWGDPRVLDKVRPRILAGQPPALVDAYLPFWTLTLSEMTLPFDAMLDRPAVGLPDQTIRDTFYAGALDQYTHQGHVYAIPTVFNAWVMWYSQKLFREHGWTVPETWDELIRLCEHMQAEGLAAIAFQGKYAAYSSCYFWHLVQNCGGIELVDRCQAMDPGAFAHPDTIEAARIYQDFAQGFFQEGSLSMTHTEAQTEFCLGRAGLVACGLWFENEMRHIMPEDFELSAFPLPPLTDGKGHPRAIYAGPAEAIYLMRDGANTKEAKDFIGYMLAPENMREFASRFNTLTAIRPANVEAELSSAMQEIRDFVDRLDVRYADALENYAQSWELQYRRPLMDRLLRGEITPEQFAHGLERGMELLRNDPDFVKPDLKIRKNPTD